MKYLIASYDDLYEGNDNWSEFEKLHADFPNLKMTFFVITGNCSDEFLKKVKQPWTQLVFHSFEHSGNWLKWTVDEAKEWLLKFQPYGFEQGFKAPGWRITDNIIKACQDLDFWICTPPTIPVPVRRYWYTYPTEGILNYNDYDEFYDHIQHNHWENDVKVNDPDVFYKQLNELRSYLLKNPDVESKFISEVLHTNGKN
jgi:hypothetical protein